MLFKCISEIDSQGMTNDGIIECLYGNGFCFSVFIGSSLPKNQGTHNSLVVRCVYVVVFAFFTGRVRKEVQK